MEYILICLIVLLIILLINDKYRFKKSIKKYQDKKKNELRQQAILIAKRRNIRGD